MSTKQKFRWTKVLTVIILIAAGVFISAELYVIGIIIMALAMLFDFIIRRCPYCNESLDIRLSIKENTHCPNCGNVICDYDKEQISRDDDLKK